MSVSFLTSGGHRLEYQWIRPARAGAHAPALVFLHEGLGSLAMWKGFPSEAAAATGCPALIYSRYGYGKSDRLDAPRAVDYMHREALETLPDLLRQLGVASPILVGHSDGASIALIHAGSGRWPVRGLVLMAPHVFVEELTVNSIAQAKVAFETTDLAAKLARYHDDPASTFQGWNDIWLDPDFRRWNIEAYLAGVRARVLLIQGEDDQYGTVAQVRAIERQLRGPVETLMLERCAHAPHLDRKQATLDALAGFVRRLLRQPNAARAAR
ncbi:MAG TPA: alpha/beta hydrolase [Burkholderiales bacterium]|nr:alpha/beta hydrolase [Burkholderiales bacterium]